MKDKLDKVKNLRKFQTKKGIAKSGELVELKKYHKSEGMHSEMFKYPD